MRLTLSDTVDPRMVDADHGWWFPEREEAEPTGTQDFHFTIAELIPTLKTMVQRLADGTGQTLPAEFEEGMQIGTDKPGTAREHLWGFLADFIEQKIAGSGLLW